MPFDFAPTVLIFVAKLYTYPCRFKTPLLLVELRAHRATSPIIFPKPPLHTIPPTSYPEKLRVGGGADPWPLLLEL